MYSRFRRFPAFFGKGEFLRAFWCDFRAFWRGNLGAFWWWRRQRRWLWIAEANDVVQVAIQNQVAGRRHNDRLELVVSEFLHDRLGLAVLLPEPRQSSL
jgi:hypothetical protein